MTLTNGDLAVTALNYGQNTAVIQVDLTQIPPGIPASSIAGNMSLDIISNAAGVVSSDGHLAVDLDSLSGKTIVVHRNGAGTPVSPPPPPPIPTPGS
jgi:hypothetical protein